MPKRNSLLLGGALAVCGAAALFMTSIPASGHHAFGAEFDANAPIRLQGPIVKLEWVNPHTWIHLDVPNDVTLLGRLFYFQGVMIGGGRIGLTEALEVKLGE